MLRRAATALRESSSNDIFRLARIASEATIRSEGDLIGLLNEAKPAHQAKTIVAGVAHV